MAPRPTELPPAGATDTLYLLDLSGYVFRAYHALPPLQNASGEQTHATLGTINMLVKLMNERKPVYVGVACEGMGNFRGELDVRYKANRPTRPPDLYHQLNRCVEIVHAYQIPIYVADGFEADDVIAAIVTKAKADGMRVVIASADKDLMQLVDDRCVMWDAMRDRVYGPAEVEVKFGVPAAKVRDLMALVGDSSDNIPGVPGVGHKTAAELMNQFATLEDLYARIDEVKKPRIKQSLIDHEADARLSQTLVTLRHDAPVTYDKQALFYGGGDVPKLRALFSELGFTRHLGLLPRDPRPVGAPMVGGKDEPATPLGKGTYRAILTSDELAAFAKEAREAGRLAIVLHTTGEEAMRCSVSGVALAIKPGEGAYVPLGHRYLGAPKQLTMPEVCEVLGSLLVDEKFPKLGHDTKRIDVVLRRHGVRIAGVTYDTMLASYLLDPEVAHDLGTVAEREAAAKLQSFADIAPKQRGKPVPTLDDITVEEATPFGAAHADAVLRIHERQAQRLDESGVSDLLRDLELPLSHVLADLETTGVMVDTQMLEGIGALMSKELATLEQQARKESGHDDLNVASPRQLETILFDELKLKVTKRTKTGRSTDAEALEAISDDHPLPKIILEHRIIAKLKGTYVDALPRLINPSTGRIHGHWRQAVAATGRISSEDPNLQNIPIRTDLGREIRRAFVAPPGQVFLSADYSQIELRVLAHLSQDPVMVDAFRTGQDIHVRTAMEVFGVKAEDVTQDMRRKTKTINFGVIYGMGELALAKRLSIPRSEAAAFIEAYFDRYQGVYRFMRKTMEDARDTERVRTLLGRLRILPDLRSTDRMRRSQAERIAANTPIQGTAADILKLAMVRLRSPIVPGARMVLTVHDELNFEVPAERAEEAAKKIREVMENVLALDVPLVVDVGFGKSWADAH